VAKVRPPVSALTGNTHGSLTEPSSAAVASWLLPVHKVRPAAIMVCFGDVPRALCSTEHDVEPLFVTFDTPPPSQVIGEKDS
jgi:hypothetical protein